MRRIIRCVPLCLVGWLALPAAPAAAQVVVLHSFTGGTNDGDGPVASLVQSGPTLYGMTAGGGNAGDGTVFKINADGSAFGLLHTFADGLNDGRNPIGS